ncbi:TrmH family RNA methyltransferase [bacterium]|nr:TrmH family RNA methyltransferase [bacterium]MCI0680366.1 TrmH family RNA methyltransferase [bacterium]
MSKKIVILHNIRSAHNVGSIFRTADAAGTVKIYLTGYTPAPVDRFGREEKKIAKTALGAEKVVPWEKRAYLPPLIKKLKKGGISVVGVEQWSRGVSYTSLKLQGDAAFIFGSEVGGLSEHVLEECDTVIEIPMRGAKESLNVAVAAGIILFSH